MTVSDTCDSTVLNEVKVVKLTSIITVKGLFNTLLVGSIQTWGVGGDKSDIYCAMIP